MPGLKTTLKRVPGLRQAYYLARAIQRDLVHKVPTDPAMRNWRVTFPRPNKVAFVAESVPRPAHDEVLIETECSLISSGTETTCLRGAFSAQSHWGKSVSYPWYPGYQNIGSVIEVGSGVGGLKVGQRVATHQSHSQFVTERARRCILVPEQISSEEAAWFALSAIAQIALTKCKLSDVRRAAVIGLGPLGQLTVQWLRGAGIAEVLPIGRSSWRVEVAKTRLGTCVADPGARVQLTIDAAGSADALTDAFKITEDYGSIILIGDPPDPTKQRLTSDLLRRGLTLIGVHFSHASIDDYPLRASTLTHAQLGAAYFQQIIEKKMEVRSLITHRLSPESATLAYELAAKRRSQTMGILFEWKRWRSKCKSA